MFETTKSRKKLNKSGKYCKLPHNIANPYTYICEYKPNDKNLISLKCIFLAASYIISHGSEGKRKKNKKIPNKESHDKKDNDALFAN